MHFPASTQTTLTPINLVGEGIVQSLLLFDPNHYFNWSGRIVRYTIIIDNVTVSGDNYYHSSEHDYYSLPLRLDPSSKTLQLTEDNDNTQPLYFSKSFQLKVTYYGQGGSAISIPYSYLATLK